MIRRFRLAQLIVWQSALDATSYPFSFWSGIALKLLRIAFLAVFFQAVFARTRSVGGFTLDEVILMVGCYYLLDLLAKATFFRNLLFYLPQQIHRGEFDQYLTRPLPLLPYVSFRKLDLLDLTNLIPIGLLVGWQLTRLAGEIVPERLLGAGFSLIVGYFVLYAVALLGSALYFRMPDADAVAWVVNEVSHLGRLPITVYPPAVLLTFLFVIPLGLVSLVPVGYIVGKLSPTVVILSSTTGIALFVVAWRVWMRQVNRYESASN